MEIKMKKIMTILAVFAMIFFVACSNTSEKETVDTGDTDPTDTGDSGDTDTSEPTTPSDPTTEPTDDPTGEPTDPTGQEEGNWESKYKKADDHAAAVSKDVVKANNDLGMKIFSRLATGEAGKNMMISPLSISIAMAMTANGCIPAAAGMIRSRWTPGCMPGQPAGKRKACWRI